MTTTTVTTTTTTAPQPHPGPRVPVERGVPRPVELREAPRPPTIVVRELGPGEEQVLDAVFTGLSDQSRYLRFHSPVPRMVPAVRRALAAVDGRRHVALVAVADGEPIGIARCIGLGSGRAELAVEVVDAWQRRGVGSRLVREVLARGRAVGHREVVAEVLAENVGMQMLLFAVLPDLTWVEDGPELTFTGTLAGPPPGDPALGGVAA